jgi:hypothetical protein
MWTRFKLLSVLGAFVGLTSPVYCAQDRRSRQPESASLGLFLRSYLRVAEREGSPVAYASAFVNLNSDKTPEVVVYVRGEAWCGSGGCLLLVLEQTGVSYRVLGRITIARTPIRVFENKTRGWRSIGVWVQGGGIQPGYEAELRFDGRKYPSNPSVEPAHRSGSNDSPGTVLISDNSTFGGS